MNRKIKKFLATVSAVAMCATSVVSIGAGALGVSTDKKLGAETVSFSANIYGNDIKFHLWQKATDYFDDEDVKIYISDTMVNSDGKEYTYKLKSNPLVYYNTTTEEYINYFNILKLNKGSFKFANKEDLINFEEYLSDNNIAHTTYDFSISLDCEFDDEYFDIVQKIKEDTGIIAFFDCPATMVQVTETENTLPAPTLAGDANEDGKVTIADAVTIMQYIVNPDEFGLTPQGMANADIFGDGDGITVMDALRIQEIQLGL